MWAVKPEYSGQTRSIPWLLMSWLLVLPSHQNWLYRINMALSFIIGSMNYYPLFRVRSWNNGMRCMSLYILIRMDFNCLNHLNVKKWHIMQIYFPFPPQKKVQRGLIPPVLLTIVHDAELQLSVHPSLVSGQCEVLEGFGVILLHPLAVHVQQTQATLTHWVTLETRNK